MGAVPPNLSLFSVIRGKGSLEPECSSAYEWMNKMWYIHTMKYYLALRRKEIVKHATTWMNLKDII